MRFNRHFRFSAMSELTEASHRAAAHPLHTRFTNMFGAALF
jgi:hypothetical protein